MQQLEQQVMRTRGVLRRAWSRFGVSRPDLVAPARLVLQMDDPHLPHSFGSGEPLSIAEWRDAIASVVRRWGPLPVTVLANRNASDGDAAAAVRFAHRLGCPTLLVTDGTGVTDALADELVGGGLDSVRITVGGVSDGIQLKTVGNTASQATGAVASFLGSRARVSESLDVEVAIPWVDGVTAELTAIIGWAHEAGVDGFRLVAPYRAASLPADPELLDNVIDAAQGFCRNGPTSIEELHAMVAHQDGEPGLARRHARRRFKCPVGGQRIVVGRRRNVYSCPFHEPIGELQGDLDRLWSNGTDHFRRIAECKRACVHTQLAPEPILG